MLARAIPTPSRETVRVWVRSLYLWFLSGLSFRWHALGRLLYRPLLNRPFVSLSCFIWSHVCVLRLSYILDVLYHSHPSPDLAAFQHSTRCVAEPWFFLPPIHQVSRMRSFSFSACTLSCSSSLSILTYPSFHCTALHRNMHRTLIPSDLSPISPRTGVQSCWG